MGHTRLSFFTSLTMLSQVISEDLMVNHFLPGLRCLRIDMEHLSPEHEVSYCSDKVTVSISGLITYCHISCADFHSSLCLAWLRYHVLNFFKSVWCHFMDLFTGYAILSRSFNISEPLFNSLKSGKHSLSLNIIRI